MGLDASVMCCCYAQGRTKPPPHPEHVVLDAEGYLTLDLPWEGHVAEHNAFDAWQGSACEHSRMEAASERIANWGGYRLFQQALSTVGWGRFTTLRAVLPNANGGLVAAPDAARCLDELDVFERQPADDGWALFDSTTNEVLHEYIRSYEGVFLWSGKDFDVGVDDSGLFVRRRSREELFRALRIEQRCETVDGAPGAELIDLDGGIALRVPFRIAGAPVPWPDGRMKDDRGRHNFSCPSRLHVTRHRRDGSSFAYILEPLRRVFRASVETGNPVRWC